MSSVMKHLGNSRARKQVKYLVNPGYVVSKDDGDEHFITYPQLIAAYGVDPKDCMRATAVARKYNSDAIVLEPMYHGKYAERLAYLINEASKGN